MLFAPDAERIATSNAWAFLHWLRFVRGRHLSGWSALTEFAVAEPAEFAAAIAAFASLLPLPLPQGEGEGEGEGDCAAPLTPALSPRKRGWRGGLLAGLLLHADLRPDDRVLVAGCAARPWVAARLQGTTVILTALPADALIEAAAAEQASVVVAPASILAEAAFGQKASLGALRTIIAVGGSLSPQARAEIYARIKVDVLLLARSGNRLWGSPLDPVPASPGQARSFVRQRASVHGQR
ncbi:MAG: hypothetical protein M3Y41_21225 [Pseudomonadota bacterium]|nr:hypothetical protein [Pseudomonadota bacterium]